MAIKKLDVVTQVCPFPLIEAKAALAEMASGDELVIEFDCTQATEAIPQWAAEEGLDYAQERTNGARPRGGQAGTPTETGSSPEVPRATDETRNPLMKGEGAEPIQPVAAVYDDEVPAEAVASQDIQTAPELVLNGAQIQAALQIVLAVAGGTLPRDTGLGQLRILFNLTPEQSEQILGSAGTSTPTTANPRPTNSVTESLSAAAAAKWEGYP